MIGYSLDSPGFRIPVEARFSAPVQTSPGAHTASCTMGTGSFPGVESGRGVTLTPHLLLVPKSKNRVALYLYSPYLPTYLPTYRALNKHRIFFLQHVHILLGKGETGCFFRGRRLIFKRRVHLHTGCIFSINHITPELNPFAQCYLPRFFYWGF
jgi:hypothetical protein